MEEQNLNLLKTKLQEIKEMGWIKSQRLGNAGGVGNTLEDLLGIPENNLQLPDFWKIRQTISAISLIAIGAFPLIKIYSFCY